MKWTNGRFNGFLRRGYALIFAFVFILHIALALLPAVLMNRGMERPAGWVYKYFRILCHQMPQRSWFLFGKQAWYPAVVPEGSDMLSFTGASGSTMDFLAGRNFYGTPEMGYKMAICQRDTAIYAAMAVFCVIFSLSGCRIPRPRWVLPFVIGVLPVAADGITQLLGNALPAVFPYRESTPLLRTVTGALFGFCLCWYLLPALEESLRQDQKTDHNEQAL